MENYSHGKILKGWNRKNYSPQELGRSIYVYKLVRLKQIPYYHIHKAVRFHPEEIQEWQASKRMVEWHLNKP